MSSSPVDLRRALIRDGASGRWLAFEKPLRVLVAETADDVGRVLDQVESAALAGHWVVGYLAYEAATGLDDSLACVDGEGPLAVFGVFESEREVEEPRPPAPDDAPPAPDDAPPASDDAPPAVPRLGGQSRTLLPSSMSVSESKYRRAIDTIRDAIREGDTYQVNYTYRLGRPLEEAPFDLFRRLVHAQAATYAAYLDLGDAAIASASPELFFRREGGRLVSRPMKGTLGRGREEGGAPDRGVNALSASAKDRAENLMIVDMVRNDLSRVCRPGTVNVPSLWTLESYPTVWQMTSTVEGESDASLPEVFKALFPPASITGAPKKAAMEIIERLEASPRGVYTGAIGFVAPGGDAQFNVAIRTAVIDQPRKELTYGVGGGIVWDSTSESEYAETLAKRAILDYSPPDFRLLETLRWSPDDGFLLMGRHLDRMAAGAAFFGFAFDRGAVQEALGVTASPWSGSDRRVRLTLGPSGDAQIESSLLGGRGALDAPRLALAPACVPSADAFLRYKTTHRAIYQGLQDACPGFDDVLLWNERGEVTESCIANLFFWRDGRWWTPPVSAGLLPGTLRAELVDSGQVAVRVLTVDQLLAGVPFFLANSVRGMWRPSELWAAGQEVELVWGEANQAAMRDLLT